MNKLPPPLSLARTQEIKTKYGVASVAHIADAFRQCIRNVIPARLTDTSKLTFVERDAVFDIFSEIAQITEEDILRRIHTSGVVTHPETGIHVSPHKKALREIIQDVARYAIFSHRWTDSEPSYQDVSAGGFGVARSMGYRLVWSDTCCIDKTNTTELSEAILAMFKWYAHAHICIVHLATASSLQEFEREPWFKRGWILQELLAPRRIRFYNKDWCALTDLSNGKDDPKVLSTLSAATGIPCDAVVADNSRGIKGRYVWEIMSWASTRKTTRIGDVAYCLFGLFDINLPITYGEGEKAFLRLIEAIAARCSIWDVFTWAGQVSSSHPVLPYSPACYPKWDKRIACREVGMMIFVPTSHGLRLTSVPLIPMAFVSEAKDRNGSYKVMLSGRSGSVAALGAYSSVMVVCGSG